MPDITINDIVISFPFKPYPVQEEYMKRVIECLQSGQHGVLESPTGTGKTLSLLCSSLSWLLTKKAQLQAQIIAGAIEKKDFGGNFFKHLTSGLEKAAGAPDNVQNFTWIMPKIIYASRTHSQLSQAMHELKRTSYRHVSTTVLGSRDQLCIHPEVSKETNSFNKIQMCHAKVKSRTCFYFSNIEARKDDPVFKQDVLDIEDLVKTGQKHKCCPYFLAKELKQSADIVFMPYNYLLDPKTRKSQGIDLQNTVVLLDEAHNVEKVCEEAASLQISSTDVAMCIDEITGVMQDMAKDADLQNDLLTDNNVQKDFTVEDLCILKAMFLELEKAIDSIELKNSNEGDTFPGGFIFELLEKAELIHGKEQIVIDKLEKIILYLSATSTSPFARKGNALQKFSDLLRTAFNSGSSIARHKEKVKRCYKVHIQAEEQKKSYKNDVWENKKTIMKTNGKLISYWCFSPGFGMQQMVEQGVRSVILTSGTLSPLKPFISELDIPIAVQLENPHIVTKEQVCVGVLSQGPDNHPLNSSYNTRNDPKFIQSLGRTVYNFSCIVPHGLLIFFPSYPIMKKCRDDWQNMGLWTKIAERKPIYVEPNSKDGFINVMNEYYQKIRDPSCKGAIFMAVCRGKVSEGLDFANANGRAVLVIGLPFPPLKDPRIMLKQRYLEEIRAIKKEGLTGQQWYQLEASRAVNQAIGRIIRHKNDYGAVILCDCRFDNLNFQKQLSAWLRPCIKKFMNFGMITKELRKFFRHAESTWPQPGITYAQYSNSNISLPAVGATFETTVSNSLRQKVQSNPATMQTTKDNFNIDMYLDESARNKQLQKPQSEINFSACKLKDNQSTCELAKQVDEPAIKRRKINILPLGVDSYLSNPSTSSSTVPDNNFTDIVQTDKEANKDDKKALGKQYLKDVKLALSVNDYKIFGTMIQNYTQNGDFDELLKTLSSLFSPTGQLQHLFIGFKSFLKKRHIVIFENYTENFKRL